MKKTSLILSVFRGNLGSMLLLLVLTCLFASHRDVLGQDILQKSVKWNGKNITYYVLQPADTATGILLLLPGKGENPKGVFKKTSLPGILRTQGYMTIVPNLTYALFANEVIIGQLSEILKIESQDRQSSKVIIGGLTTGGSIAMSYAEYLVSEGASASLSGIFAIDAPLDLQRLYGSSRKMRRFNCSNIQSEGQQTIDYLEKNLGGSPDDQYANYLSSSPFMANEPDGGRAKWLAQVPVRLYCEPDIDFVKERLCTEIEREDLNAVDLERLVKQLRKSGNDHSEYLVTKGRGYQTWNIAEPEELAAWIDEMVK